MSKKRSAIEQRKEKVSAQIAHLRKQLTSKTRKDFTTDFRYSVWIKQSNTLIEELLQELSILEEPGEYNELPVAVIAEELGLSFEQIRQLIKIGEIEAIGKRAHERVNRKELERLARLGADGILKQSREKVEDIFRQAVSQVRSSDVTSTERSYRRLKARQSIIGNYTLATEIAIQLVQGMYEEAERVIKFILHHKLSDSIMIGTYLGEFLQNVSFKNQRAKTNVLRVLKQFFDNEVRETIVRSEDPNNLELTAMYITTVVRNSVEKAITPSLSPSERTDFYQLIKDSVFSALYAEAHKDTSLQCQLFVLSANQVIPTYWGVPSLFAELLEE